ncbi:MAG: SEL1-like repeat protein [Verrucomicrobia bacterium]|nr:SEL1-like repeat protein [Verrucomicrobiota bacterium]
MLKILPLAAAAGVAAVNSDALKKSLDVVDKVRGAATSGVEMQGIAEAVAQDYVETKSLPIENFGAFLKDNMREKGGKETRDKSKDPWGTEYRLNVDVPKNGFSVLSAGPDKNWKSQDDLNYFYSLTGIEGKNAISAELAARARAHAAKQGTSSTASTSNTPGKSRTSPRPNSSQASTPKPPQSAAETERKLIEFQTKRAASGEAQASYDLAIRYFTEDGVAKDYVEAKRLLEQAVKNADTQTLRAKAQTHLDNLNKALQK